MLPSQDDQSYDETGGIQKENLELENIAKAVKRVTPEPSPKISELEDKVNSLGFDRDSVPQAETDNPIKSKRTFTFGTLSNLRNINFEEQSPVFKFKGNDTPTPSGIEECRLTIMKMLDESVSGRNYPLKSQPQLMKEASSSSNNKSKRDSDKHETNFSFFLKKNALINYYDASPGGLGAITPETKLTKPNQFFAIDNSGTYQNEINEQPEEKPTIENNNVNFGDIGNGNNINANNHNMYLNVNMNMNLVNPVKIKKKKTNNGDNQNFTNQRMNFQNMNPMNQPSFPNQMNPNGNTFQNNFNNFNNNYYMGNNPNKRNPQFNMQDYYTMANQQSMDFNNQQMPGAFFNNPNMNNFNYFNPQPNNFCFPPGMGNNFNMNPRFNQGNMMPQMNQQPPLQNMNLNPMGTGSSNTSTMLSGNNLKQKKQKTQSQINFSTMSLSELIKNSNVISKDQSGCRFLQKKIEEQPEIASKILNNALQNIIEIITDPFGNYLIQKLFDYMTEEQICQFIALIQIEIYKICINSYGTRVIQKIIDYLHSEVLLKTFLKLIKPIVKRIILDINGSHILIKLIELNSPPATKVVYGEIAENIVSISMHKHGCCVLQKCIERAAPKEQQQLFSLLLYHCKELIIDQCGNYIIQFMITLNIEEINMNVAEQVSCDIENYSKQKYSSNVVEKCLECGTEPICNKIIKALLAAGCIVTLLFDKFGNYVVQKALQRADQETQQNILNIIAPHLQKLKNFPFGMKLYSKLIITYSYLSMIILGKIDEGNNVNNDNEENEDEEDKE